MTLSVEVRAGGAGDAPAGTAALLASAAAMAEVRALRALHYDPAVVGPLSAVVSPPYDVIDASQREELLSRSPFNVIAVDLPQGEPDPYTAAAALMANWRASGAVVRDELPALWAHTQQYTGPDGRRRTRRGFFCRARIEGGSPGAIRGHERTHPGPKEDRLRLTRATRMNISPIFSLYSDPRQAAWAALEPATELEPWAEVSDAQDTVHRVWRVSDPEAIAAVQDAVAPAELLIADGHHRYETMRDYAAEVDAAEIDAGPAAHPKASGARAGGAGAECGARGGEEHRFALMCLVALEDPGLEIFATHRVVRGLDDQRHDRLLNDLQRDFEMSEVAEQDLAPAPGAGPLELGYIDAWSKRPTRLRLRSQSIADEALQGRSEAYRHLDTGVLEALVLKGSLGLSGEDIASFNGLFYARDAREAVEMVRRGEYQAAFLMRPTPVQAVSALAELSESMPPKSTYFYPKLLTGLLFNELYPQSP
jgi:uncharacterized protein (DUF1015 family)